MKGFNLQAVLGALVWVVFLIFTRPDVYHHAWAECILLFAALVIIQLMPNLGQPKEKWVIFGAAMILVVAFLSPKGWMAGAFAFPWLCVTVWQFYVGVNQWQKHGNLAWNAAQSGGRIFLVVGGLWTMSDRLNCQPLGFSPDIVLLTGVHFHYAGLFFPMLIGLVAQKWPHKMANAAAWLALASVPLTAIGITLTQVSQIYWVETVAAGTVALAGWMAAIWYLRVAVKDNTLPLLTRFCWFIVGFSLLFSMTLALGYAIRPYYAFDILQIPTMRAWHGTVNAFGVAFAGMLGWSCVKRE